MYLAPLIGGRNEKARYQDEEIRDYLGARARLSWWRGRPLSTPGPPGYRLRG